MSPTTTTAYEYILIDFEFRQKDGLEGNPIEVICMSSKNLATGEYKNLWADELVLLKDHPFGKNENQILVALFCKR